MRQHGLARSTITLIFLYYVASARLRTWGNLTTCAAGRGTTTLTTRAQRTVTTITQQTVTTTTGFGWWCAAHLLLFQFEGVSLSQGSRTLRL
jgi:hypothetical protein